ncbi:serine/threonine-protein kinase [Kitasatospora sp. NPDC088783]|uniref:serine/threonine-protein kinase n=1 Tax=Kitasatospora sp. NPDC088783 TaxID=3364077 RepID=UPI0037FB9BDE
MGEQPWEPIRAFGQWLERDGDDAGRAGALTALLHRLVLEAAADAEVVRDVSGRELVVFDGGGRTFLLEVVVGGPAAVQARIDAPAEEFAWAGGAAGRVLVCPDAVAPAVTAPPGGPVPVAVLDADHVDAAVCGAVDLVAVVKEALRPRPRGRAVFAAWDAALREGGAALESDPMGVPDGALFEAEGTDAVQAHLVLAGGPFTGRSSGLADGGRGLLLVTCPDGVITLDPGSGATGWLLRTPGCEGPVLPTVGQAVLVLRDGCVLEFGEHRTRVLAGGFPAGARLVAGSGGEAWVLSGSGAELGVPGSGTLALTLVPDRAGQQARFPVTFDAQVYSAVCLRGREFLLCGGGHSAVVDLTSGGYAGAPGTWIAVHSPYPGQSLLAGPGRAVTFSPDGSGLSALAHRVDVLLRTSARRPLLRMPLSRICGAAAVRDGAVYVLGVLPGDPREPRVALVRVRGLVDASALAPAGADSGGGPVWRPVAAQARGLRRHYKLEPRTLGPGGQGAVHPAVHKPTGIDVAFKTQRSAVDGKRARMVREVEVGRRLAWHPHVVPVLDIAPDCSWFVMPVAQYTASTRRAELAEPAALLEFVRAIASALRAAHEHGWVHRDVKPPNVLFLDGVWRLADWGLARRPRGETTDAQRTRLGLGTEGWAAPELSTGEGAHNAGPSADIYSLGQMIGWIHTGRNPTANKPLLPADGPWRHVVRQATHDDPARRPQSIDEFMALVERELAILPLPPGVAAKKYLAAANGGGAPTAGGPFGSTAPATDPVAAGRLLDLAADHPGNQDLYLDVLTWLREPGAAMRTDPVRAEAVLAGFAGHCHPEPWQHSSVLNRTMLWLLDVARDAARHCAPDVLEAAVETLFAWQGAHDQWTPRDGTVDWLGALAGADAARVAAVLRRHPYAARHYQVLVERGGVDEAISTAVYAATRS